jgi:hypothetical protein
MLFTPSAAPGITYVTTCENETRLVIMADRGDTVTGLISLSEKQIRALAEELPGMIEMIGRGNRITRGRK